LKFSTIDMQNSNSLIKILKELGIFDGMVFCIQEIINLANF